MSQYVKKPVVIEAFKYDGDLGNDLGEYYVPQWGKEALMWLNKRVEDRIERNVLGTNVK